MASQLMAASSVWPESVNPYLENLGSQSKCGRRELCVEPVLGELADKPSNTLS